MIQSEQGEQSESPRPGLHGLPGIHVAIIMDGNGRWAERRGLPRPAGHHEGTSAVRRIVEAAPGQGIDLLTLYAFSADNWRRPPAEVAKLMGLFEKFLTDAREDCVKQGVRITVLGRRDRVPRPVSGAISGMEEATRAGTRLHVRLAVDYSARDAMLEAARLFQCPNGSGREVFARCLGHAMHAGEAARDVDLLIRTGGEQRLSDFLLWECSYAELYFTQKMWPEFSAEDLREAVREYHRRDRRYGCAKTLPAAEACLR